jgi:hypothetical protein
MSSNADSFKIDTADTMHPEDLEDKRPDHPVTWELAASGFWEEGRYHSGHIAYFIANIGPGEWLMDGVERDDDLDDMPEDDVEDEPLNDDEAQPLEPKSLADAPNPEYRQIVAACSGANAEWDIRFVAAALYRAVCRSGGKAIDEPDGAGGLLDD